MSSRFELVSDNSSIPEAVQSFVEYDMDPDVAVGVFKCPSAIFTSERTIMYSDYIQQ